ncbi:MAG: hypothetical protein JWQ38_881 [Flavipsychrobacter sp.]|nr:hypothetical protein [Flavipsychrobacter sp.]
MELESMKSLWQAHEKELKKMSTLNEQLVSRILKDKSNSALEKIKNAEYLGGSVTLLAFAIFVLMINQLGGRPEMIVSYIIVMVAFIATLVWGIYKLRWLSGIDISAGNITDTANKTQRFKLFILRERFIGLLSLFLVAPAAYILVYRWVRHESAADHLAKLVVSLILGIIFSVVLYRRLYLNNLNNILENLKETEAFRKDL